MSEVSTCIHVTAIGSVTTRILKAIIFVPRSNAITSPRSVRPWQVVQLTIMPGVKYSPSAMLIFIFQQQNALSTRWRQCMHICFGLTIMSRFDWLKESCDFSDIIVRQKNYKDLHIVPSTGTAVSYTTALALVLKEGTNLHCAMLRNISHYYSISMSLE